MLKKDIKVGGKYTARVSGKFVTVLVERIKKQTRFGGKACTSYDVKNLSTGRETTFHSAAKFRSVAKEAAKQRSDPTQSTTSLPGATARQTKTTKGVAKSIADPTGTVTTATNANQVVTAESRPTHQSSSLETLKSNKPLVAVSLTTLKSSPTSTPENLTSATPVTSTELTDKWRPNEETIQGADKRIQAVVAEVQRVCHPFISKLGGLLAQQAKPRKLNKEPTPEQRAILDAVQEEDRVLMIEAGAGAGKTTVLQMIGDTLPGNGQYTAFNSALVGESKAKFAGTRVACNTTHSLAFRADGKRFADRLDGHRVRSEVVAGMLGLREIVIPTSNGEKRLAAGWLASQIMGAIRRFCQSADAKADGSHFKYVDGIDMPSSDGQRTYDNNKRLREHLLPYAEKAWVDLSNPEGQLPFSHDHYVKVWQLSGPVISADYIMIDEAQDLSPVFLDVLQQQRAKVILVGDSAQQIYEWRGAVNALAAFPEAPRLFLSQSFRFGQAIADVANKVLETLQDATPLRLKGLPSIPSEVARVEQPVAILCRTNACAVSTLLNAIAEGRRPFLVGGGSDVIAFVRAAQDLQQAKSTSHPELACFGSWLEVQEYAKLDDGEDLRLMVKLIDSFGAQVILSALQAMPSEKDADLVISTGHKSKGREWDTVRLAADFPTMSKCQDADRKLLYVAVTRAKLILDTTECPFFTGDDSLDISDVISRRQTDGTGILPPAPSAPPPPTAYTWSKDKNGNWLVRGPQGSAGLQVDVERKDGSKAKKRLGSEVWRGNGVALYRT